MSKYFLYAAIYDSSPTSLSIQVLVQGYGKFYYLRNLLYESQ